MGEVWLAEQTEPIRRKVALKLIKAGMDSAQVLARFEAERQALALMDHPCIARVYDAGTTASGRPYFAMEFVQGTPIDENCDKRRADTRQRLALFQQVCHGVQHAHQKAVLHRDLKPSNILVSDTDVRPMPKIIDFGVAKATSRKLTDQSMHTSFGQLIGTPEYMSPEQAELTTEDVDTRTDVYSLGVILYDLLVDCLPFDPKKLRAAGFEKILQILREEDPARPSTRLQTEPDTAAETAKRRRTQPRRLASLVRGDLDWIVLRALPGEGSQSALWLATLEEVRDIRERNLGPDHIDVLRTTVNTGTAATLAGDDEKALRVFDRLLPKLIESRGEDHPDVLVVLRNTGVAYRNLERYDEARPVLERGLRLARGMYADEDPRVATARADLAVIFHRLGRNAEARDLLVRAFDVNLANLGA